ncbi:class I SAM-dependent methyltransferase [Candidatus Deferrimicrobium sp.]|uniref:class I SAM-dependent methyltransferase n=1 Tax=Candidatus Deferrimicrobium sp. TaxID=3060586 RepID=UPI003C6FF91D
MNNKYVHGYTVRENVRLVDQATTLADILHSDTVYPAGSNVLEAGCGVGAQTIILARNSPNAKFTAIDQSEESLRAARDRVLSQGFTNVTFHQSDIFHLPYEDNSFDHLFICFVLEHLPNPIEALLCLRRVLKKGGTITVIEGDHGSTYFFPESPDARKTIQCLVDIQAEMGGNSLIGRQLYPLLKKSNYYNVNVSPRMIYVDSSKPNLVEGFTKNTFIAMVEGVKNQAIRSGLMKEADWEQGIRDLQKTTGEDGTFIYTFFKGKALK